jgi:hypothetical protein
MYIRILFIALALALAVTPTAAQGRLGPDPTQESIDELRIASSLRVIRADNKSVVFETHNIFEIQNVLGCFQTTGGPCTVMAPGDNYIFQFRRLGDTVEMGRVGHSAIWSSSWSSLLLHLSEPDKLSSWQKEHLKSKSVNLPDNFGDVEQDEWGRWLLIPTLIALLLLPFLAEPRPPT